MKKACCVTILPPCDDEERVKRLTLYHSVLLLRESRIRQSKKCIKFVVKNVADDCNVLYEYEFRIALAFRKQFKNAVFLVSDERFPEKGVYRFSGRLPKYLLDDMLPHCFEFRIGKGDHQYSVLRKESEKETLSIIKRYVYKGYSYTEVAKLLNTGLDRDGIPKPRCIVKHRSGKRWTRIYIGNIAKMLAYTRNHL